MIRVAAAIIFDNSRVLAARKREGLHLAGYWEFPGGKLEKGETPQQCLSRELAEELGITCDVGEFLDEVVYDYGDKVIRLIAHIVRNPQGSFLLTDHDTVRWLAHDELDDLNWAPADRPIVMTLKQTPHLF